MARLLPAYWGGRSASAIFVLISMTLFALSSLSPQNVEIVRAGAADLLAPVLTLVNRPFQVAASYVDTATGLARLEEENAKLRDENTRLREWYQTAMQLQASNESLEKLLHVAVEPTSTFVTARVVADSGNTYVKTLLVMAGHKDGVDKGQAVISGEGLIGRTIEVGDKTARILLITDINSRVPVTIEGSDTRAILAGRNDDLPILTHLPAETQLQIGARVITSGAGGIFPFGLPVGVIEKGADGSPSVRMFADSEKLIHVRIINPNETVDLLHNGQ